MILAEQPVTLRAQSKLVKRAHGGYECPSCSAPMAVVDSRPSTKGGIRRRRECTSCGARATTYEVELSRYHDFLTGLESLADQARIMLRGLGAERDGQ